MEQKLNLTMFSSEAQTWEAAAHFVGMKAAEAFSLRQDALANKLREISDELKAKGLKPCEEAARLRHELYPELYKTKTAK